jgi:hypothetical protein
MTDCFLPRFVTVLIGVFNDWFDAFQLVFTVQDWCQHTPLRQDNQPTAYRTNAFDAIRQPYVDSCLE